MENKVYVLIKCGIIKVLEENCCCCGPEEYEYNDEPKVIGVYKTLEKLKEKLKKLEFNDEEIKYIIKNKWNKIDEVVDENFYYLEEVELN